MSILKFPIERTAAGKAALLTRQVEILLREKRVVGTLLEHLDRLTEIRRDFCRAEGAGFRRDQVQPAFNTGRTL